MEMNLLTGASNLKSGSYLLPAIIQSNKGFDRTITVLQLDSLPVLRVAKLYRQHKKQILPFLDDYQQVLLNAW